MAAITVHHIRDWTGILWLALTAVWLGSAPFSKRTVHGQSGEARVLQVAFFAVGLYLLFGTSSNAGMDWLNRQLFPVSVATALTGLGIAFSGIAFSIWARLTLGNNWSGDVTLKQDHALIRSGPYRFVRHPIYTGFLIGLLGTALERGLVRSLIALPVCVFALWLKVKAEEKLMVQRFGDEYLRYRQEVRALAPFLF